MLADGIRQFGNDILGDLRELWRRLVFSLLASNYDDHLRNHGFLMHEPMPLAAAPRFGLKAGESKRILREVFTAVSAWRETGRQLRLKIFAVNAYASAFEHPLMDEARQPIGK